MNLPQVYMCSPSWTLLPPPSPYHPSGSSQCTSPKHPGPCIEPGLATRFIYDIIHISMPFSQIIPLSPSPTESKRLFYISVSLLLSRIQGYGYCNSLFKIILFIYLFLTVLGLRCWASFSLVAKSWGYSRVEGSGFFHRCGFSLWSTGSRARGLQQLQHMGSVVAPGLWSAGSVVVAHRLSHFSAHGMFLDQGLKQCLLHWQATKIAPCNAFLTSTPIACYPLYTQATSRALFMQGYHRDDVSTPLDIFQHEIGLAD